MLSLRKIGQLANAVNATPNLKRKKTFIAVAAVFANTALFNTTSYAEEAVKVAPVAITGNPLGVSSDELVTPVSVLNGRELSLRRESTLGNTLNSIPGVTANQFGPNASRPVIRGLDSERVKIMQNGIGVLDASSLSFDHAVSVDPLIIEQIDVVRGPAALLYGGSAIGGVVNAIDHRIPTEAVDGIVGRTEARFGGPDNQRNGAIVVDLGNERLAIHLDAFKRKTDNVDIPGFAVSSRKNKADGTERENKGELINSDAESDGGAIGASLTFDNGYIGASFSTLDNEYGIVAEEDVRIDMTTDRWDIASEFTDLGDVIHRVKFRLAHTDYLHQELEGTEVGTTFKNRGTQASIEAGHAPIAGINGVIGYQMTNTNFSALGDEAFIPEVNTQTKAVYFYEELPIAAGEDKQHKVTFGGRFGRTTLDSKNSDNPNFGAGKNESLSTNSYALGGIYAINKQWSIASNLSHNERAPSYFELFANGEHIATSQFEVGDINLNKERSNGIDAQLRWKNGQNNVSLGAYYTRFNNFIGLFDTGNVDAGSGAPIAQFIAVPAVFKGLEAEGQFAITKQLKWRVRGDYVHAKASRNDAYLPRISPLRIGTGLDYTKNRFNARIDVLHAFKQNKTAQNELATDSYTDVSALIAYKLPTQYNVEIFAKANNLLNQEIRQHASFLKDSSVAGERSILIGARADF
ncbi:MAG: TonB-dependent receptor [Methylophilaceae bacterium]